MAKNQHTPKGKKIIQGMSVHQKLGIILKSKVVPKLSLEKNVFAKKWSPKLAVRPRDTRPQAALA